MRSRKEVEKYFAQYILNAPYTTEAAYKDDVMQLLRVAGAYVAREVDNPRSGVPDLLVCFKGRFIGIETKDDIGTASAVQKKHIKDIIKSGGKAAVCRTLADVLDLLYMEDANE